MAPPVHLHVSPGDDAPIYRQIVRQVLQALASNGLVAGERLPSHRELAKELVVAPLTVKKAYDVLEADGVIETRRGRGTFIRETAARSTERAQERVRPLARRLLIEAEALGLGPDEVDELVRTERAALEAEKAAKSEGRNAS